MEKSKINKLKQTINLIEELSWLLEGKRDLSLKESSKLLNELIFERTEKGNNRLNLSDKGKDNRYALVGCLPELFQDVDLFKTTSELLEFAETVLNIRVSRAAKRSRNEYIGYIVCEVTKLQDDQLGPLVESLENIVGDEIKLKQVKAAKMQPNFTWNETIKSIGSL
jgi:hypothetical protein